MPPRNNQKKDNNKLKNKKQPKLTENKLYGSLTTKELKKKHSIGRRGGDGQPCGEDLPAQWWLADLARQWISDWAVPHSRADKLGGKTGERDRPSNPEFQCGEIKTQTSD